MHLLPQAFLSTTWVKMFDISDSELIMLYRENNEEALDILNQKYNIVTKRIINKYYPFLRKLNINFDELTLSCHELINEALDTYNSLYKASLNTYISLIIDRKVKKTIINAIRYNKKNIEVSNINFDNTASSISSNSLDPLEAICASESQKNLNEIILNKLNNNELAIFSLLLDGLSYKDIAFTLMQSYKQIYKKVQNIRKKLIPELQKMLD